MLVLGSSILLIIGILMLFCPGVIYELTEKWKSNTSAEPSDLYRLHIRIGGIVCTLIGVVGIVTYFLL